jgi:hypothetical protein
MCYHQGCERLIQKTKGPRIGCNNTAYPQATLGDHSTAGWAWPHRLFPVQAFPHPTQCHGPCRLRIERTSVRVYLQSWTQTSANSPTKTQRPLAGPLEIYISGWSERSPVRTLISLLHRRHRAFLIFYHIAGSEKRLFAVRSEQADRAGPANCGQIMLRVTKMKRGNSHRVENDLYIVYLVTSALTS